LAAAPNFWSKVVMTETWGSRSSSIKCAPVTAELPVFLIRKPEHPDDVLLSFCKVKAHE
jgi:hypothetical protein